MIVFKFEIGMDITVKAATATAAYKKLVDALPTTEVSRLDIKVTSQKDEE